MPSTDSTPSGTALDTQAADSTTDATVPAPNGQAKRSRVSDRASHRASGKTSAEQHGSTSFNL